MAVARDYEPLHDQPGKALARMQTRKRQEPRELTGADSRTMLLWSILEKSRMSPRMVSSVSPLSRMVSASSLHSVRYHLRFQTQHAR